MLLFTTKKVIIRLQYIKSKYPFMKLHKFIFSATCVLLINSLYAQSTIPKVSIHFAFDKSLISAGDFNALENFKAKYPNVESIIIDGYADTTGTDNYNYALSGRRCAAVRQALNYDSTKTEVFTVAAHGEKDLLFNSDPENRVVIVTVDPKRAALLRAARNGQEPLEQAAPADTTAKVVSVPVVKVVTPVKTDTIGTAVKTMPKEFRNDESDLLKQLQNSKVVESVVLTDIRFEEASHQILKTSKPALNTMLDALKKLPALQLEIQGHMCCDDALTVDGFDTDTKEFKLSYNRAKAVYDYMVSNGIDASRLSYKGFGTRKRLVYPEKTDNDRSKNRRVEFLITKI